MKYIFFVLINCTLIIRCAAQTPLSKKFHEADTLVFESQHIHPGDTLQLGFGSNANKDFVFISFYGGMMNAESVTMPAVYSNHFVVYDHMLHKAGEYFPVFYLDGKKKNNYRYLIDFGNAVMSKEIILK